MHNKQSLTLILTATLLATSCATHYKLAEVSRDRILIDNRYDAQPDAEAEQFISPFRAKVDSVMGPVVGKTARALEKYQPESPLSNLMADILVWGGKPFNETPDFAVYNIGGIRASFPAGEITFGDVLDVAPFENKICFCSLNGAKVKELFQQMAGFGGQGVSHGVEAVMDAHGKLTSLKINGKDVDDNREYRIATLDYVAEGNDKMLAFKSKYNVNSPADTKNNVRYIIVNYFKALSAQGKAVDSQVEGRFVIQK